MVRIALLADPGSGGTTVLGLLYATQVRRASTDATDLRFQVAPSSIPRVSRLLEDLKAGEFPTHSGTGSPVEFLFERPRTGFASLRGRGILGRHSLEEAISVQWTRASFADLRLHLSSGGFSSDGARQLEGADVLAVVVPARGTESTGPKPDPDPDTVLADALSPAAVPGRSGAMPSIGLAFVFTMLDRLPEARRKELGFAGSLSDPIPPEQRERLGLGLLEQWMPRTRERLGRALTAEVPGGVRPRFFYSWVEPDPAAPGRPRLRASPGGGWEPAYPVSEYTDLINSCETWAGARR